MKRYLLLKHIIYYFKCKSEDNDEIEVMFVFMHNLHIDQKPFCIILYHHKIHFKSIWFLLLLNGFWTECLNTNITFMSSLPFNYSVVKHCKSEGFSPKRTINVVTINYLGVVISAKIYVSYIWTFLWIRLCVCVCSVSQRCFFKNITQNGVT